RKPLQIFSSGLWSVRLSSVVRQVVRQPLNARAGRFVVLTLIACSTVCAPIFAADTTPTPSATPGSRVVRISIGSAVAGPGDVANVTVSVGAVGVQVAATDNDLAFRGDTLSLDSSGCVLNPAIDKSLRMTVIGGNGAATTTIRVSIQSTQNSDPIANGPLYTCALRVAPTALSGTYRIDSARVLAF